MDRNKRVAHTLTLHARAFKVHDLDSQRKFPSKSCPLRYGTAKLQEDARKLFDSGLREFLGCQNNGWAVTSLSVAASKIVDIPSGTGSILRFFQGKNGSPTSSFGSTEFVEDDVHSSLSGCKSDPEQDVKQKGFACEKPGNDNDTIQDRALYNTGKWNRKQKDKGTCSILRFFPGSNSSSLTKRALDECVKDDAPLPPPFTEIDEGNKKDTLQPDLTGQRSETWNFRVEDIDPSVINELPLEIQKEVRGWLRQPKRANTAKRGSSIAHYFSSAKNE